MREVNLLENKEFLLIKKSFIKKINKKYGPIDGEFCSCEIKTVYMGTRLCIGCGLYREDKECLSGKT